METRKWNVEYFGQKLGTLTITKDEFQGEITLAFEAEPSPDLEVRTSTSDANSARFTFKEKQK